MATDYDTPRNNSIEQPEPPSLASLRAGRARVAAGLGDDLDPLEAELELPGASLDDEELSVTVIPQQSDEFTCTGCFLVHHRSQLADPAKRLCRECAV